jgi:AraC-like DNA-binding protein
MRAKTTAASSREGDGHSAKAVTGKERNAHRSFNLAIARYGDLVDAIIDLSHRGDPKAEVSEALVDRIEQVISELVAERNIGVLAGLLQLMGGGHPDLQHIAIQTLVNMDREPVSAIVEEVTSAPKAFDAPGAMLLLAMMGTPQALSALEGLWSRLDLPYPLRARALRLLAACKTGFFDEQWGFSEELKPDAETLRDLLELLGNTLLTSLSAFHLEWLGGLAQEMLQTLEQDAHLPAVAAVGHVSTGMSGLRESLERAREILVQAISRGVVGVVHCDEADGVHSDSVAQLSQIDARMAEALCSEDDALFDRVLDEEFSSVRLDAGNGSASLLVSIAGSAAELAVRAGAPRENVFPIKIDFLNRVRVLKEPAEVRPLLADLREALRSAIGNAQVGRVEHQIAGAREYLDHHYAEDISREELAAAVNMSPWHLTTAFHRIVGMSPRDYLHRARIEAAKKRLLTTTDSVSEVAYSIGYGATSNFRRIFYKWVRCSPTTYRRHTPRSS